MNKGARLISEALLGIAVRVVVVNGKRYIIESPTIHKIAGAANHLSGFTLPDKDATIADVIATINDTKKLAAALSWLIQDNEKLTDDLSKGTLGELVQGIEAAYQMIDMRDFTNAVGIAKCVAALTARPR